MSGYDESYQAGSRYAPMPDYPPGTPPPESYPQGVYPDTYRANPSTTGRDQQPPYLPNFPNGQFGGDVQYGTDQYAGQYGAYDAGLSRDGGAATSQGYPSNVSTQVLPPDTQWPGEQQPRRGEYEQVDDWE